MTLKVLSHGGSITTMQEELGISDVAERSGIAAGTIRMWEQRYGFPMPQRTPSGYRRYTPDDVERLRRVQSHRNRGLSVPAAIERARESGGESDLPSLYAAVSGQDRAAFPHVLRKSTLTELSRAIEHETLAHAAAPVLFGAFQEERFFRVIEPRWRRLAAHADACVVFADFPSARRPRGGPVELPIERDEALGNEWSLIVDAPGFAASLVAWEQPRTGRNHDEAEADRRFEAVWTLDPATTRRAALTAARMAEGIDPELGAALEATLADRPLAFEQPVPALTALANRVVSYMEQSASVR
jgi:MerR family transcriptional regulator, light-induced transcriptional regulator